MIIHEHFTPGRAGLNVPLPVTQTVRKGRTLPRKKQRDRNMTALLKITYKAGVLLMAACTGLIVCSSCTDEEFMKEAAKTDKMSFGVSISDKWSAGPGTRSVEGGGTKYEAYKFDNSDMWIIASEEEGIENATFPEKKMETRGMPITNAKELSSVHKAFGVYAYHSNDDTFNQSVSYISNEEVSGLSANGQNTVQKWVAQSQHFWPRTGYMKFYAFSPSSISGQIKSENNTLKLDYTVPETSTEQPDILLALPQDPANASFYTCSEHKNVDLTFRHVLTAVKVRVTEGINPDDIESIKLTNVYGSGTLNTSDIAFANTEGGNNYNIGANKWTLTDEPNVTLTSTTLASGSYSDGLIVDGEATFMVLPQQLTDKVKLEVNFKDGKSISGSIGGMDKDGVVRTWLMGHTYIYRISWNSTSEEYIFEVTPKEKAFDESGGKLEYDVKSYKKIINGSNVKYESVSWYVDPKKSTGLALFPEWDIKDNSSIQGSGITNPDQTEKKELDILSYRITDLGLNMPKNENSHNWDLSLPLPRGTNDKNGNPINDNTQTTDQTLRSTSNCYMVFAQGPHKFPLVYGNAIKKGSDNEIAYKDFVNHAGQKITSPFIEENLDENGKQIKVTSVELLWQDSPRLINSNSGELYLETQKTPIIVDGKTEYVRYIKFQPYPSFYVQGNAVIVAKSGNTVVWSWHIWFTNYRGDTTFSGSNGYQFMDYYLGWCAKQPIASQRTATLHFIQRGTEKIQEIQITQSGSNQTISYQGYCPVFQWGRKDAMPGIQDGDDGYVYKGAEAGVKIEKFSLGIENSYGSKVIGDGIKSPDKFYGYYNNWLQNTPSNLWNVGTSEKAVKTVYDPSPRGFMVPPQSAYNGFGPGKNKDGKYEEWESNGRSFYYANYRQQTGGLMYRFENSPSYAYLWTSTFIDNSCSSTFTSSGIENTAQAQGNPVLPVKEKE